MKKTKNVILKIIGIYNNNDINSESSQLAYGLLLSFFPCLIGFIALLGYSNIEKGAILNLLIGILPQELLELTDRTITEILKAKKIGLFSFAMVIAVWSASNGLNGLIKGLNKAYNVKESRSFIKLQLMNLLFTIIIIFMIFSVMCLLVFGEVLNHIVTLKFLLSPAISLLLNFSRNIIGLLLLFFIFAFIYKFIPSKKLTYKNILPGALFSTFFWIIFSTGFSFYVNSFASFSKIYGSLGGVMLLMTWLFLCSNIILLGGELNAAFLRHKEEK